MKKISEDQLEEVLEKHRLWLEKKEGGEPADLIRADLTGADLSNANLRMASLRWTDLYYANLRGANLSGANLYGVSLREANLNGADLSGADLCGANLSWANLSDADLRGTYFTGSAMQSVKGINYASCTFAGHGPSGRQLLAVVINGETQFFCGCFKGDEIALRQFIEEHEEKYKEARLHAMNSCLQSLKFYKTDKTTTNK